MLEHMMFKGTEKLGPNEFSRIIAANGGRENAFTGRDYTAYFQSMEKTRYPVSFELESHVKGNCSISGVDELIAQMLDKLISNAVDFHAHSTPIVIRIQQHDHNLVLSILNQGESLPEHMQDNLFESMVSVRSKKGEAPHLGLGLYIVRLIVDFHEGSVRALNRQDTQGVEIRITLPERK